MKSSLPVAIATAVLSCVVLQNVVAQEATTQNKPVQLQGPLRMARAVSQAGVVDLGDGRHIHYQPSATVTPATPSDYTGLFYNAACADIGMAGCMYSNLQDLTPNTHFPATTAGFGGNIYLDTTTATITVGLGGVSFATTDWYMDAPNSPLVSAQNPYPWCPPRQAPDYYPWYVEKDSVFAQSSYVCWQSPARLQMLWEYPFGLGLHDWHAYSSISVTAPFTLDPVVLKKADGDNGDGQTIAVNSQTLKPLIVELKTAAGTPVNFPLSLPPGWSPPVAPAGRAPTATVSGPGKTTGQVVKTELIGGSGSKFAITVLVGAKAGAYTVSVTHPDADPTNVVTFTINVADTVTPPDNTQDEQGTGDQSNDPAQQGQDQQTQTDQAQRQNDKSANMNCAASPELVADPINVTNGNALHMEVDYAQTGLSPIEFVRTYNSKGSVSAMMGNYWTTTYDRAVFPASAGQPLRLRRADGLTIRYALVGGSYVSDASFHGILRQNSTGWQYIDTNQTIEDYDSTGKLTQITDLRGRTQTLTYTKGLLTKVAANTGESLSFSYTNNQLTQMSDQTGRTWTYAYNNSYKNLASLKYPNGIFRTYWYSDPHNPWNLTGTGRGTAVFTNENLAEILWAYDAQGRATANWFYDFYLGQLRRTDIAYGSDGTTRSVADGDQHTATYATQSINGHGFVNSIAGPGYAACGNDLARQFDGTMNVLSKTQAGHVTTYSGYDTKGQYGNRVAGAGTSDAVSTSYVYDARYFYKPTQITEPSVIAGRTKITTLTYDAFGNVVQKTIAGFSPSADPSQAPTPISRTWNYQYNGPYHQLSLIDGPRTDVADTTALAYSANGRLQKVTDANGIVLRNNITYTPTGNIASEDRPNGLHIVYSYDAQTNLLLGVTETQGTSKRTTTWTYDGIYDRVTGVTFSDGVSTDQGMQFDYNNDGQISTIATVAGTIHYTYDGQGNPTRDSYSSQQGEQNYIQRTFDAYNRVNKLIGANNTIEYDSYPDGTLTQSKDGKQQATQRVYDGLKRLTKVIRPDLSEIHYSYDAGGNLNQVTDPHLATTTYLYDDLHQKVAQTSPDTGTTRYGYDAGGNLVQMTDANGNITTYTYDAGNRVRTVARPGGTYNETYTYDSCTNGTGLLCSVSNGAGETVSYQYNGFGEVANVTTGMKSVSYKYDAQGHVTQLTYPSGRTVKYTLNAANQITQVSVVESASTTVVASNIQYQPWGPATGWTYGNGLAHTRTYDKEYWTRSISTPGVSTLSYPSYDLNGNVATMTVDSANDQFTYDIFDELMTGTGDFGSRTYGYDAVGNRTSLVADGAGTTYAYTANSNRITSQTQYSYTLDANGNTLQKLATDGSGRGYSYTYSPHNRLVAVYDLSTPATPKATYGYNALGQRVQKNANGVTTRYLYGLDGKLLAETDAAGNVQREYVYLNGAPLALLGAPQTATPPAFDTSVDTTGTDSSAWTLKSDSTAVGGSYAYLSMAKAPAQPTSAFWNFSLPYGGYYDVYVWWEGSGETSQVYTVFNGSTTISVGIASGSQTKGTWVKLGNYHFTSGSYTPLRLDSQQNAVANKAYLAADAARMVLTNADVPPSPSFQFVHVDHLGAPRAITDASGKLIWKATYDPFGLATVNDDVANTGTHTTLNLRVPGQYFDAESGLHYNYFRDYDPSTGRYIQSDPVGLAAGTNTYAYANVNPVSYGDSTGLYAGADDLVFTGGGAAVGLLGQGVSDLLTWHLSSWQDYTGAAIGGAAGGETLLYTGPVTAGLVGGAVTNASKQWLKNQTGVQCGYNFTSFAADSTVGGLTGLIPGLRVLGITAGRGSWNAIFKQMSTKFGNGTISSVTTQTALKMAGGRAVDTAVVPAAGAGSFAGSYLEPYIPGYGDACGCPSK